MFPYRRGNKKRGKGGPAGRHQREGGRRVPGSAHEVLALLQPATKALAQMLAGHTRASGQLVHARNVLAQAERLVDERQADRLFPAQREEFFEQLARLKLTLADADAAETAEMDEERAARPASTVAPERLRELALSLATTPAVEPAAEPEPEEPETALPEPEEPGPAEAAHAAGNGEAPAAPEPESPATRHLPPGSPRRARLRLKTVRRDDDEAGDDAEKARAG